MRDGSATVAAGRTSGGAVGQWTRVGEGKMNQVAQHRLMISKGMGGGVGVNILHVCVINLGIGWVCVNVRVCVRARVCYCNLSSGSGVTPTHHIHTQGTMGFSTPPPDDESR